MIAEFEGDYRFLSNFYNTPICYNGIVYRTSEHAYQAAKHTSTEHLRSINNWGTPGGAKRAGKKIRLRSDWEAVKIGIMTDIIRCKFFDNPDLLRMLLETESELLVEGNNWGDNFWGSSPVPANQGKIVGLNWLGVILMDFRDKCNMITRFNREIAAEVLRLHPTLPTL
jgi:ribA/ribD-fused uncharacterized protein